MLRSRTAIGVGGLLGGVAMIGAGVLWSAAGAAAARLPVAIDIPAGPQGVTGPGGDGLPSTDGQPTPGAPAISMISDATLPDETLVITGENLQAAALHIWAEGGAHDVTPLKAAGDRMLAVVPKSLPASTMLVWPVAGEEAGSPIRVNGATVWWSWPARLSSEDVGSAQSVLLMGKNLKLDGAAPKVYIGGQGVSEWLTVTAGDPYQLRAELPRSLRPGSYQLWAHNGTGGRYGWSEPMGLEVVNTPQQGGLRTFRVGDHGAKPGDNRDDARAIQKAVDAAGKAGGGIVAFAQGTYMVSRPITTPAKAAAGIHFQGAGMGGYEPRSARASGKQTTLQGSGNPAGILHVTARFSSVRGLNLVNSSPGYLGRPHDGDDGTHQVAMRARAHDLVIEDARFVLLDDRPNVQQIERKSLDIYEPALQINAPGGAHIRVRGCEFHSAGSGIHIGAVPRGHYDEGMPAPSTDYLRIEGCTFRGYSIGAYKHPKGRNWGSTGIFNSGIVNYNGKNLIVEGCDFAGADRQGNLMMNRTVCTYNSSIRNTYFHGNTSHDIGMNGPPASVDAIVNQGEQYLFHFRYPVGGFFDVLAADGSSVALDPGDPRAVSGEKADVRNSADRSGSRILVEVGKNDHWIVFVAAGKGAGQYRVVTGASRSARRATLELERPWRVIPDTTSRVVLGSAYRQNIVSGNTVDGGRSDPRSKTVGVLFWMNAFENVVAGNTLRNLGYGVGINTTFRSPTGWNLLRDNRIENMRGAHGAGAAGPTFYTDHFKVYTSDNPAVDPGSDVRSWYSVGNTFRANQCRNAPVAAYVHGQLQIPARDGRVKNQDLRYDPDSGMVMEIVENNSFLEVQQGVVTNPVVSWGLIRNNELALPSASAVIDQSRGQARDAVMVLSE